MCAHYFVLSLSFSLSLSLSLSVSGRHHIVNFSLTLVTRSPTSRHMLADIPVAEAKEASEVPSDASWATSQSVITEK